MSRVTRGPYLNLPYLTFGVDSFRLSSGPSSGTGPMHVTDVIKGKVKKYLLEVLLTVLVQHGINLRDVKYTPQRGNVLKAL